MSSRTNPGNVDGPFPPVSLDARAQRHGHAGGVVWLTGLSGSGKSTLAYGAEAQLFASGHAVCVLDGDGLRGGLCGDLGFSMADRRENTRRTAEVAALFAGAGLVVLVALISPAAPDRQLARRLVGARFQEVFVRASLNACERRDPKGLYRRARAGELANFTGISSPYDPPTDPDLVVDTEALTVDAAIAGLVAHTENWLHRDEDSSRVRLPAGSVSTED